MVYVLLGEGFEEIEALTPVDLLRRAGVQVATVGIGGKTVSGGHGIRVEADLTLDEMDLTQLEMLVIPGGLGGVATIRGSREAMETITFAWENQKLLAAICAGPTILAALGITDGKQATCYPGCEAQMGNAQMLSNAACTRDGTVITGTSAGCAVAFALELISDLRGREAADAVARQIVIR